MLQVFILKYFVIHFYQYFAINISLYITTCTTEEGEGRGKEGRGRETLFF